MNPIVSPLSECIRYFKSNPEYHRVLEKVKEKYRSLGFLGGTIQLDHLSSGEKEALSGLLRKDYYNRKSASIKVDALIQALEETKFEGVPFEEVLRGYFRQELVSKKEEQNLYELQRDSYFQRIVELFPDTRAAQWLKAAIETGQNAYPILRRRYDEDRASLYSDLVLVCQGINALPFKESKPVRLALFSSALSKNPHCFDRDSECGKLLLYGIVSLLQKPYPQNAEEKAEMLYDAGIIDDEISNFTTCSGLLALQNGKPHAGWFGFLEAGEPLQVSLSNLSTIDQVLSPSGDVFVFENPTVFSEVHYQAKSCKPALLCTYGQLKLASLVLLDKLAENSKLIYYSGDFDPEGLAIADKLKQRYGHQLVLWRYTQEDYSHIRSSEAISPERLKKLQKLKSPELQQMADILSREGYSAYQELLIPKYIEDIKNYY